MVSYRPASKRARNSSACRVRPTARGAHALRGLRHAASCGSTTSSQFFVGKQAVSLATLRKYAARGPNHLDVYYETKSQRVTRLILRTQLDAGRRAREDSHPGRRKAAPTNRGPSHDDLQDAIAGHADRCRGRRAAGQHARQRGRHRTVRRRGRRRGAVTAQHPVHHGHVGQHGHGREDPGALDPAVPTAARADTDRVYWSHDGTAPDCEHRPVRRLELFHLQRGPAEPEFAGHLLCRRRPRSWRSNNESAGNATLSSGDNTNWIECEADAGTARPDRRVDQEVRRRRLTNGPWSSNSCQQDRLEPRRGRSRSIPATTSTGRRAPPSRAPASRSCRRC